MLVDQSVGTKESIVQLEELTRRQMEDDITAMEGVLGAKVEEAKESADRYEAGDSGTDPEKIVGWDRKSIPRDTGHYIGSKVCSEGNGRTFKSGFLYDSCNRQQQGKCDLYQSGQMRDDLTLFTTLAHEGYPGHLYQTIFYESTDPDPVRSIFNFGGYVEGWATYAEMCSYYLTPLPKEQATILQKNGSVILHSMHWRIWESIMMAGAG